MKYKLNLVLTDIGTKEDSIKEFEFNNIDELSHKINSSGLREDRVYLCCITDSKDSYQSTEILVSENYPLLIGFMESYENIGVSDSYPVIVHFHSYESYEDAYIVARDMRESNPLCYNN